MKSSEKLVTYKKAQADYNDAIAVVDEIHWKMELIGSISISSGLSIDRYSSEKQFLYALGILNNQIAGCPLLNLPDAEYIEKRDSITTLWELIQEWKSWTVYAGELREYQSALEGLLDSDDRFQLLEYPVKK